MATLLYKDESYKIIGACFEVYNHKGFGFTEPVYQECLGFEFAMQCVPLVAQPEIYLSYKGNRLTHYFKPDFICYDRIVVEIKSVAAIADAHRAQTLNYLNALGLELGILVNFGQHPKLAYERLANTKRASRTIYDEIRSWTDEEHH
ncbi:MAG TPA: GxxExxY protein [Pyrinomonadaceae bacterium]|nr:GxxExxY protein [Pyrinomonadaceae bacterium]